MMIRPNDVFPAARAEPSGQEKRQEYTQQTPPILMSAWHDPTPLPEKLSQIVKKTT